MANYWVDSRNKKKFEDVSAQEVNNSYILQEDMLTFRYENIEFGRDHRKNKTDSWIRRQSNNDRT